MGHESVSFRAAADVPSTPLHVAQSRFRESLAVQQYPAQFRPPPSYDVTQRESAQSFFNTKKLQEQKVARTALFVSCCTKKCQAGTGLRSRRRQVVREKVARSD